MGKQVAYFGVQGKGSMHVVTHLLGIAPTDGWSEGDPISTRSNRPAFRRFMRWRLDSGLLNSMPLELHLEAVVTKVEAVADRLSALPEGFDAKIVFVANDGRGLGLRVDQSIIRRIAALHLSIDIDFYSFD